MSSIRILIADDHPLFRDGLRTLLESCGDMTIVGDAATGAEAVALVARLEPDVVLMDIKMPDIDGIEATRRIARAHPAVRVLMLTMFEDDDSVFGAVRAGAGGYLLKGARGEETLRAIRAVANGEAIFGPGIAQRMLAYFSAPKPGGAPPGAFPELTDREYAVLGLIARRRANAEIAAELSLSPKTVRNYVSSILGKLQVADRAEAMLAARAAGLGDPPGTAERRGRD